MNTQNTIQHLTGYNKNYRMSKCVESETIVSGNDITTNLHNAKQSRTLEPSIVDALASIGLFTLLENEPSVLGVESRILDISTGKFAQRRKGETVEVAPTVPETIEQLDVSTIASAMDGKQVKVPMDAEQLVKYGFYSLIPPTAITALEGIIKLGLENAERVKVLRELFSISQATITEETADSLMFSCKVSMAIWPKVFNKLKASSDRGWTVNSVDLVDDFTNMSFNVVLDKAVNDGIE